MKNSLEYLFIGVLGAFTVVILLFLIIITILRSRKTYQNGERLWHFKISPNFDRLFHESYSWTMIVLAMSRDEAKEKATAYLRKMPGYCNAVSFYNDDNSSADAPEIIVVSNEPGTFGFMDDIKNPFDEKYLLKAKRPRTV